MGACQFLIGCEDTSGDSVRVNYNTIRKKKREQKTREKSRIKQRENEVKKTKCLKCRTYGPGFVFVKYLAYIYQYGIEVHGINVVIFQSIYSLEKNKTAEKTFVDALYLWKESINTAES